MSESPIELTTAQKVSASIFGLALVVCSMEMVPGWGFLHLNWPNYVYYGIMAVCGIAAGYLIAPEHRIPGAVGGFVSGLGALFTIAFVLDHVNQTNNLLTAIAGGIGILPGLGLYKGLAMLEDLIRGAPPSKSAADSLSTVVKSHASKNPSLKD